MQMSSSFFTANFPRVPGSTERAQYARGSLQFLRTPACAYLELAGVVVVGGALSALLQRDEGEASEVSGAGGQEDHCKRRGECISSTEMQSSKEASRRCIAASLRVALDDATHT